MKKNEENGTSWEPDFDSKADRIATDKNLLEMVMGALEANIFVDSKKITVRVTDRVVFLEGNVHWKKERISAQECVRDIFGIRAVINYLTYPGKYS